MAGAFNILGRLGGAVSALVGKSVDPTDRFFAGSDASEGRADATRPYREVSVVYACVRARFMAMAQMPLMVSTADDQVLESGPLVDITECPNPKMTQRQFWKATSAYLDLSGACYWWFSDLGTDDRRRPVHVYPYSANKFRKRFDSGVHTAWWYRTDQGFEIQVALEEVHEVIEPDYEEGLDTPMSPRHAVQMAVQQYYKADRANLSSLDNDVQPGGLLRTDGTLTPEQRKHLKQDVIEGHGGVLNRRRIMVAEGGLHFERIQAAFSEMEFTELKKMSRTDICAGYLVPPAVAGFYEDSNYSHTDAADRIFWIGRIIPLAETLAEEWTVAVLARFGSGSTEAATARRRTPTTAERTYPSMTRAGRVASRRSLEFFAWFDANDIPVVQQARLASVELAKKWWDIGVPLNPIIRATGAPFEELPHGEQGYRPMGLVSYEEDVSLDEPPDGSQPEDGDDLVPLQGDEPSKSVHRRGLTEKQREALHEAWWKTIQPLVSSMRKKIERHFNELRREVKKNLDRLEGERSTIVQRNIIGQILFDLTQADNSLRAKVGKLIHQGFVLGGAQSMEDAAIAEGRGPSDADLFQIEADNVARRIRRRENRITGINATLHRRLTKRIADGFAQEDTIAQIAESIRSEFNLAGSRASTIARTEVAAAVEEAKHEGRRQAGVPLKSWLSSRREDLRKNHLQAEQKTHNTPIELDELFVLPVTGNLCEHPRATGDPRDDINCGCTTLSRYPDDERDARLITHRMTKGFLTIERAALLHSQTEGASL